MTNQSALTNKRLPPATDIFDMEGLRARVEGDLELFEEMIELYLSSSPLLLTEIESAVASRDARENQPRGSHAQGCA